ncbi:MAG: helix-turn-helix transcriptional regulator [Myxococcota bacterium]
MTFGTQVAAMLRAMRRAQKAPQEVVAKALPNSISAVSRLERGLRNLRVDQLVSWAGALGYRVDVVFWTPAVADQQWDPEHLDRALGLEADAARVLAEVASGVSHMPPAARQALVHKVQTWKTAAQASPVQA